MQGLLTKLQFIPEQHTDFIFSALGEETGFLGCIIVLAAYLMLAWRLPQIAGEARSDFESLVVIGVLAMVMFQVVININMTIGLGPVTGIPRPDELRRPSAGEFHRPGTGGLRGAQGCKACMDCRTRPPAAATASPGQHRGPCGWTMRPLGGNGGLGSRCCRSNCWSWAAPGAMAGLSLPALHEPQVLSRCPGWVWSPAGWSQGQRELPGRHGETDLQLQLWQPLQDEDGTDPLLVLISGPLQVALALHGSSRERQLRLL